MYGLVFLQLIDECQTTHPCSLAGVFSIKSQLNVIAMIALKFGQEKTDSLWIQYFINIRRFQRSLWHIVRQGRLRSLHNGESTGLVNLPNSSAAIRISTSQNYSHQAIRVNIYGALE